MTTTTKQDWPIGPRELIGGLLDYAERYADLNEEPADGACREAISKGQAWFESGTATVDVSDVGVELAEYVTKFAEINGEPEVGNCRRLLGCAASTFQPPKKEPNVPLISMACSRSVDAGQAAIDVHQKTLMCDGDASVQLWHLLASLHEWCAVQGVDFDQELKDFKSTFAAGELNLPAAQAALQAKSTAQAL